MFIVYIVAFLIVFFLVSKIFNFNPYDVLGNMVVRVLSGIIFISVCNYLIFIKKNPKSLNIHLFDKNK